MRRDKFVFSLLITLSFVVITLASAMALSPSGSITLVAPSTMTGTELMNISLNSQNIVNCSIWAYSSSTANSTYTNLVNVTGTLNWVSNISAQANVSSLNITINSTTIEDSNDYYFKAICSNSTVDNKDNITSAVLSSRIMQNTVPTTPTSLVPSDGTMNDSSDTLDFSASVTNSRTTGCTLYFPNENPGATSYAMTYSGSSCTYALTNVPEQTYRYYIQASDGTDTTNSATTTVTIDIPSSSMKTGALLQQPGVKSEGGALLSVTSTKGVSLTTEVLGMPLWFAIFLLILVVVIVWAVRRK